MYDLASLDPNLDYTKILPIQQKRTLAFVNHFVMNTVSLLNTFAQTCESRLMEFEDKMQKIEASLLILESQLSSISSLNDTEDSPKAATVVAVETKETVTTTDEKSEDPSPDNNKDSSEDQNKSGPIASQDPRFSKFFKMLQFGVPFAGVQQKMKAEGVDPHILETPAAVIPGLADTHTDDETSTTSDSD